MKCLPLLSMLVLLQTSIYSQTYLKKILDFEFRESAEPVLIVDDTIYYTTNVISFGPDYNETSAVVAIDTNGNVIKYAQTVDTIRHIVYMGANLIKHNNAYVSVFFAGTHLGYTLRAYDLDLNLKKMVFFPWVSGGSYRVYPYKEGYIVAGRPSYVKNDGSYGINCHYMRYDKDLNQLWEKTIPDFGFSKLEQLGDTILLYHATYNSDTDKVDQFFTYCDSLGNIIKQIKGPSEKDGQIQKHTVHLGEQGFLYITNKFFEDQVYIKRLARCDKEGNLVWVREFGNKQYLNDFKDLIQTQDGHFVAVGRNTIASEDIIDINTWDGYAPIQLVKVDIDGNVLWDIQDTLFYDITGVHDQAIKSVVELQNGHLMVLGEAQYPETTGFRIGTFLLRYDQDGCRIGGCRMISSSIDEETTSDYVISPNPFHNSIRIEGDNLQNVRHIIVYDSSGNLLYKTEVITPEIDLSALPSGLYIVGIITEDFSVSYHKIMKN